MTTSARAARRGNEYWEFNPDARRGAGEFRYNWSRILPEAAAIITSYGKDAGVTLRQLFYRLVASERLPNTQQAYGSLSSMSAEARRGESKFYTGTFPSLMDRGRDIDRPHLWTDAADAAKWLSRRYMEDRAATQEHSLYVIVEKNALRGQLFQWFSPMGIPVIALGGYASQTLADQVYDDTKEPSRRGKPQIAIFAGDFDADGEDIQRDFEQRAGCFDEVVRVGLTPEQIEEFRLPPQPGKWSSARAQGFADKYADLFNDVYGLDLVQIELDALPPQDLRRIYKEAIDEYFDYDAYREVIKHEKREQAKVDLVAEGSGPWREFAKQVADELGVDETDAAAAIEAVQAEWLTTEDDDEEDDDES